MAGRDWTLKKLTASPLSSYLHRHQYYIIYDANRQLRDDHGDRSLSLRPPEDGSREIPLLAWVPLAGEEDCKSLAGIGDKASGIRPLAKDIGRVTVGCHRGGSAREESSSTSDGGQGSTSALRDACCCDETKRRARYLAKSLMQSDISATYIYQDVRP